MLAKDALTEENHRFRLIRLGVALHTVADTFSHFGFSGRHHDENNVGRIWNRKKDGGWELQTLKSFVGDIFVPRIGHIEAFDFPDQPFLEWRYTNNASQQRTRGNLKYSINGVKLIYHFLKLAKDPLTQSTDLAREHAMDFRKIRLLLKSKGSLSRRCDRWKNYTEAPEYNKTDWRQEALEGDVEWDNMSFNKRRYHTKKLKGKNGFDTSKWAYFHRAAFKQRSLVVSWLN